MVSVKKSRTGPKKSSRYVCHSAREIAERFGGHECSQGHSGEAEKLKNYPRNLPPSGEEDYGALPVSDMDRDPDEIIDELNRRHFVVNVGGKVYIANLFFDPQTKRIELTLSSIGDFKLRYSNRFFDPDTTIATFWLQSPRRRQYKGIVFLPGQEVDGYFNLFQGFPVEPIPGNCDRYWTHVRDHICSGNMKHYAFLRRWMAHGVQHPDQLPGTAVVLKGLQGMSGDM